jgi:hypothetical protein
MKKLRLLGNVCACALLVVDLVLSNSANAGTVGMPGQWSFIGQAITYDPSGLVVDDISLDGNFDFDTGTVYIKDDSPFFGLVWQSNGTLSDQLDGTYAADLTASGNFSYDWEILWEITQTGTTALVLTVDTDADGIPGTAMHQGPFPGFTHQINGSLTAVVPIPAAAWLFGSGLLGLIGLSKKKKII